ncbi:uncharacterized protein P884DRAFT_264921 [Thermothelomyces heterothallicus CBS 202.75]|uniref:uncharacterized protein n=1 Tax=Thermothelomyces heterothallicus CBS 202.75 TaxID=1149848 RepID=UPI0037442728
MYCTPYTHPYAPLIRLKSELDHAVFLSELDENAKRHLLLATAHRNAFILRHLNYLICYPRSHFSQAQQLDLIPCFVNLCRCFG